MLFGRKLSKFLPLDSLADPVKASLLSYLKSELNWHRVSLNRKRTGNSPNERTYSPNDIAALRNIRHDRRVSEPRAVNFLTYLSNLAASGALDEKKLVEHLDDHKWASSPAEFQSRELNGDNFAYHRVTGQIDKMKVPGPYDNLDDDQQHAAAPKELADDEWLVTVCVLKGRFRTEIEKRLAQGDDYGKLNPLDDLEGELDDTHDQTKRLIADVSTDFFSSISKPATQKFPTSSQATSQSSKLPPAGIIWAGLDEEFRPHLEQGPIHWLSMFGQNHHFPESKDLDRTPVGVANRDQGIMNDPCWVLLLRYQAMSVSLICRPSVLEAGKYGYHHSTQDLHPATKGGKTVPLLHSNEPMTEFVRPSRDIEARDVVGIWELPPVDHHSWPDLDLERAKQTHRSKRQRQDF